MAPEPPCRHCLRVPTPLGGWLRGLMARMHKNAAVVALANKLARIAWAVLRHGETFTYRRLGGGIIRIGRPRRHALIGLRCLRVVESEMA